MISLSQGSGNLIFPDPLTVFKDFFMMLGKGNTYIRIGWTLLRTLEGFGIALLIAIILGTIAGLIKKVQVILKPLMIVFKSAPTAAFVFLFLVLFGGKYAPIYVVSLLATPILYESIIAGFNNIPQEIEDALKVDANGKINSILKVKIPLSIPFFMVGLASSFALSLKTEIMAEIITGGTHMGLGTAIYAYRIMDPTNLSPIFAITLIAITIVLIVDLLGYLVKKKFQKDI